MIECDLALAANEQAPAFPARRHRNEVLGRGQLDVDSELFLQPRDRPKQAIVLWNNENVDVNRALAPAEQDGGRPSCEVHSGLGVGFCTEVSHKAADAIRVGYLAHSAARSKLTSRRISALYRECEASETSRARKSDSRRSGNTMAWGVRKPNRPERGAPTRTNRAGTDTRPSTR